MSAAAMGAGAVLHLGGGLLKMGKKLEVPDFKGIEVDPDKEQADAISGNIDALPAAQELGSKVNEYNAAEAKKMLAAMLPGYENLLNKASALTESQLSGEIPQDVQNAIQNNAAARSIGGGYSGSQVQGNLIARDLGRTSMEIQQQGFNNFDRMHAAAGRYASPFDVTSMFLTPQQRMDNSFRVQSFNKPWEYENAMQKAYVDSQPEPWKKALGDSMQMLGGMVSGGGLMGGKTVSEPSSIPQFGYGAGIMASGGMQMSNPQQAYTNFYYNGQTPDAFTNHPNYE